MAVRIIVCGGRKYSDGDAVYKLLDYIHATRVIAEIIHGGAPGADSLAGAWAKSRNVKCTVEPADWKTYGDAAGPIRNKKMLEHKPDGVVAFPGGRGTYSMRKLAKESGIPVYWL
ncbi:hypothetical protein AX279_19830 [Pseudomonas sp. J237]|jgi:hypothetical protein|nr:MULTISPECIES: DUF2493 domain-containing protein [Pseudomonas]OEO24082.1 hypothetical protein AX279_19830 [Pseudomonas sp. J237]